MVILRSILVASLFLMPCLALGAAPTLCIAPISPFLTDINLSQELVEESYLTIVTPESIEWDLKINPDLAKNIDRTDLKSFVNYIFKLKKCDFVLAPKPSSSEEWSLWIAGVDTPHIAEAPKKTNKAYQILQWVFKELGYNARVLRFNPNESITVESFQTLMKIPNIQGVVFKNTSTKPVLVDGEDDVGLMIEVVTSSGTTGDFRIILKDSKNLNFKPAPGDKILLSI